MARPQIPPLTAEALGVLDRMPFDPAARGGFDVMSGGLAWPDAFPRMRSPERAVVYRNWMPRLLIAYRASITLGEERLKFRAAWEQVVQGAPNWPGLRPERRGDRALRRLRAALRCQDECLAELEAEIESSDPII
ncbi:hypothetical protein [Paludisphaera soli]|uniref:hypothetical protein n=1 Tax=Paludisphaera soli TaxID=2712865 RepID=UPI0013EA0585|nr:hypothetical protein [Paludisphaera soli]